MEAKKVKIPTLPQNIRNRIIILPAAERFGVTPVVNPTVPIADADSNIKSAKGIFSKKASRIAAVKKVIIYTTVNAKALRSVACGMVLRIKVVSLLLCNSFHTEIASIPTVVVLIPPPVEDGDAPNIINIIITIRPRVEKRAGVIVSKPAVLQVTLAKIAFQSLERRGMSFKESFQSEIKIKAEPRMIRTNVIKITIFEWIISRL